MEVKMKKVLLLLLAVVDLIHCQDTDGMVIFTLQEVLEKLEGISDKLKGYEDLLHTIPDMHEKLEHLENNIQELHRELEHVKGAAVNSQDSLQRLSIETEQCLRGNDLEYLTNVSAAANQEIKSFVHDEISGVISLVEKDECSEGSHSCGSSGICQNTIFSYTCSCPSGFIWDGSDCVDMDECADAKDVCSPNAICKNSFGSYSCSCNKPFEGDGRTCCEFQCKSPARVIRGLGCIQPLEGKMTFQTMSDFCQDEGGRLLQDFQRQHVADFKKAFELPDYTPVFIFGGSPFLGWVGVYDEKWTSDESLVPDDLWKEEYRSEPSKRCGILMYESSTLKVTQDDCSLKLQGICQFLLP